MMRRSAAAAPAAVAAQAVVLCVAGLLAVGCGAAVGPLLGPGRPWHVAFNGYGHVFASIRHGVTRLTLVPERPELPADTHAALVLSRRTWRDLTVEIRLRTNRQLRRSRPNPWEAAWILWHYLDERHFYYLILKTNGWELGKEDPNYPGNQRFLATGSRPAFPPTRWYTVRVQQRGDVITVDVDGHRLVRFTDTQHPYRSGQVGLYTEDASATFQPTAIGATP